MAYTTITFKHPVTTEMKQAPVGFSWTTFFFGLFPAMFRSDWKWAGIQLLCAMFTWGLSSIVFCFIYNSKLRYLKHNRILHSMWYSVHKLYAESLHYY